MNLRALLAASVLSALARPALPANVVVGQVAPRSGLEATQGRAYGVGMELLFKQVNRGGGVNGNLFTLVRKDDGGRPDDTIALTKYLLAHDKPLVLAGYFGNKNIESLLASDVLRKEKIALVGYRAAIVLRDTPYLYNVRAGLREEIRKLTEHLAIIGITKIGVFYEADDDADSLLHTVDDASREMNVNVTVRAAYSAADPQVAPAVQHFLNMPPQAIEVFATGAATAAFIEQYRAAGGSAQLFTHSGADVEQMARRLSEEQLQGVAIAQVTPSPYTISSKVSKELNDLVAAYGPVEAPISYAMIEGFIAGKVIVEAVRRQGRTPTREGTAAALDTLDRFDVGGYVVGYKNSRSGSRYVELTIVTGAGKIRQ